MPTEIIKIIGVAIIAFGLGSTFVQGQQTLEINQLNSRISSLEKDLEKAKSDSNNAQAKLAKQNQKIEQFYKSWKEGK